MGYPGRDHRQRGGRDFFRETKYSLYSILFPSLPHPFFVFEKSPRPLFQFESISLHHFALPNPYARQVDVPVYFSFSINLSSCMVNASFRVQKISKDILFSAKTSLLCGPKIIYASTNI